MTARLPSLSELDRRVRDVEREGADLRGLVMHVGERTQDNNAAIRSLTSDFGGFYGEWKASGLASFAEEWKTYRAESAAATARESATNLAQDARIQAQANQIVQLQNAGAQLQKAGQTIADGAERAENAGPAIVGAIDRIGKIGVPPRGATLRQWATFFIASGLAIWEVLRTAGVVK